MHWGHVPCVPAAIDRFRGTPGPFVDAMREVAPEVRVLWPDDGVPAAIQV
jgi:hypothetical protein